MSALDIPTARVFAPLLQPARDKAAHGGRGSGKSHFFAGLMVEEALRRPGFRGVCIREVQKSLKESAKRLIEDKIQEHGLGSVFDVQTAEIKTPGGGVITFQGMQDHTAESIKSLEGFDVAWGRGGPEPFSTFPDPASPDDPQGRVRAVVELEPDPQERSGRCDVPRSEAAR